MNVLRCSDGDNEYYHCSHKYKHTSSRGIRKRKESKPGELALLFFIGVKVCPLTDNVVGLDLAVRKPEHD